MPESLLLGGQDSWVRVIFEKILVPSDGNGLADKAVDQAVEYCKRPGASIAVRKLPTQSICWKETRPAVVEVLEQHDRAGDRRVKSRINPVLGSNIFDHAAVTRAGVELLPAQAGHVRSCDESASSEMQIC